MKCRLRAVEYNVVIKQPPVATKTKGGLMLPDEEVERRKHAAVEGEIVNLSPMAFTFDDWPADEPKPAVGQKVLIARHAGTFWKDEDGEEYRVVKDKDVVAVIDG